MKMRFSCLIARALLVNSGFAHSHTLTLSRRSQKQSQPPPNSHNTMKTKILHLLVLIVLTLPARLLGDSFTVTVTVDNGYGFGVGDVNGLYITTNYAGIDNCNAEQITGSPCYVFVPPDDPQGPNDTGPEVYNVLAGANDYIYIVAWSDDGVDQGAVASFTDNNTGVTVTTSPNWRWPWQVFATGMNVVPVCTNSTHGPTLAAINAAIATANASAGAPGSSVGWVGNNGWDGDPAVAPTGSLINGRLDFSGQFNGNSYPHSVPSCIAAGAQWMEYNPEPTNSSCNPFVWSSTSDYTNIPNFLREYLIYRIGPLGPIINNNCCPDSGGVKYVQNPSFTNGINVNATFSPTDPVDNDPWVLADDFPCTNSGPITDIHLWGSWLSDQGDYYAIYTLAIWSDVPATTNGAYNHPGQWLWTQTYYPGQYTFCLYTNRLEQFYNGVSVNNGSPRLGSSSNQFYLCFDVYPTNSFYQTGTTNSPTNYWLSVTVQSSACYFGWKSSVAANTNAAVAAYSGNFYPQPADWYPMTNAQGAPANLAFKLTTATNCAGQLALACAPDKTVSCSTNWSFDSPTVWDPYCGTNITCTLISSNSTVLNSSCKILWTGVWQITDCCTNSSYCTQMVTVVDTTPPIITCASDKTVECGSNWTFDWPNAYDPCCGTNVTVWLANSNLVSANPPCQAIWQGIWKAMDCCSNVATCTQTVTVLDTQPPILGTICVTNVFLAGDMDNFVGPDPTSPSAGLLTYVTNNYPLVHFKGFDDCTVNEWVAHTFSNLPPCITAASLTLHVMPCGDISPNDDVGLYFVGPNGTLLDPNGQWSRRLGTGSYDSGVGLLPNPWNTTYYPTGALITLNLDQLSNVNPPTTSLLADLNQYGFLDVVVEDDTAVDYLELTVVSCCCSANKTVECGTPWAFDPPSAWDVCCGTNITYSLISSNSTVLDSPCQTCGRGYGRSPTAAPTAPIARRW